MTTISPPGARRLWFQQFHDLMPFMVREILIVSSHYDAFILEEDGRLDERLFSAYSEHSLTSISRIIHVASGEAAMEVLARRRIDLVVTVVRIEDTDAVELSAKVKERYPELPVVLLAFDEADLEHLPGGRLPDTIEQAFLWTGDARILLAAIKLVEDSRNVRIDTRSAGVRVIIVVEDNIRRYSTFLALLYAELMHQSHSLIGEGLNALHRRLRMRARPKILLATNYEEAISFYEQYGEQVVGVISDVRFPREQREDPDAGFALVRHILSQSAGLPILVQSADEGARAKTEELGVWFANKNAPTLLEEIRRFLKVGLGFGDFVFRLPDETEVSRARNLYELEQCLHTVLGESIGFHAAHNHFSRWLNARGMFALAERVRARSSAEFGDFEQLRAYLLEEIRKTLSEDQEGVIADFHPLPGGPERRFVRLGGDSIGGKGRGIAFVNSVLARFANSDRFEGLEVRIPKTVVIGTEEFDRFMEHNEISRADLQELDDADITRRFLDGRLSDDLMQNLEPTYRELGGPLAVRSSSLLEDSRFRPFAGIYATVALPNNHPDPETRTYQLRQAIKTVYASTFSRAARSYMAGTPHSVEDEKMAVIIQPLVGHDYGERYYPHISGVAQSHNYYPVGGQLAQDGIVLLALGLGHGVMTGGRCLRFSPANPAMLPQFASPQDLLENSQREFVALDMTRMEVDFVGDAESSLGRYDLATAERDGSLASMGSVYSPHDNIIRDRLSLPGPRVVTFNNILKWSELPLASHLQDLLNIFRHGMGGDVEIEFAVDLGGSEPRLYVLQVRPMAVRDYADDDETLAKYPESQLLCRTGRALGDGRPSGIRDVVYVKQVPLDGLRTPQVAMQIGEVTDALRAESAPYMLIGPGRWGSLDPSLGIPVDWSQIAGARVIVETVMGDEPLEPSQGTHFLHNITHQRIGYLTLDGSDPTQLLDIDWLDAQPAEQETAAVRHVRVAAPLRVHLDGRHARAIVAKPA